MTVAEALAEAEHRLADAGCETPGLDARVLLKHATGRSDAGLIIDRDEVLTAAERDGFDGLVARRAQREPVAYVIGAREFHSLDLGVEPGVLVPRPETETLVEAALELLAARTGEATVVDVGTGTGAIAIAIAAHVGRRGPVPAVRVLATDCSPKALALAARNRARLVPGAAVSLLRSNLTAGLADGSVDLLVSNPPYLTTAEIEDASPELAFEPRLALDGTTPDGLGVVRRLFEDAARVLAESGCLLIEIGTNQSEAVREYALGLGFRNVRVLRDLGGRPRVVRADRP